MVQEYTPEIETEKTPSDDSKQISITVVNDETKKESPEHSNQGLESAKQGFSDRARRNIRIVILVVAVGFLFIGRFSVPNIEITGVQDKALDFLGFANKFINTPGNEFFRSFFQLACSLFVDATFIITFGYWVFRGTSARLPISLAVFYVTRALIQKVWVSPFPEGFYWESPGMPSLVVPYGRGSDFFFSGHSGFMVICAAEWHKLKFPKIRNFVILAGIYTVLILMVYRIHYSIDCFTGVFFAEWCFTKIDLNKEFIDNVPRKIISKLRTLFNKKPERIPFMEILPLTQQQQDSPIRNSV